MSGDYGTVFVLPAGICGSLMKLQQPRDIAGALCSLRRTMSEVRETMDQRWIVKYSPTYYLQTLKALCQDKSANCCYFLVQISATPGID